jgi:E3 ubiquitin-protein ligase TRIP12
MYKAVAVGNRLCAKREEERRQEIHDRKLKEVKCTVDFSEPRSMNYEHLRLNLKREQMLEERYEEIDRHNRILLQKMAGIMRKPAQVEERPKSRGTLNKPLRIKELHRITKENQGMLERIQRVAPTYNRVEWEEDARRQEKFLQHACEFPLVLRGGTPRGPSPRGRTPRSSEGQRKRPAAKEASPEQPESAPFAEEPQSVYKGGIVLLDQPWLVEMRKEGLQLLIAAYRSADEDRDEVTLELLVDEKEYRRVFRECGGAYEQIAARLEIRDNQLALRAPATSVSAPAALLNYESMTQRATDE